jgi:hypothetical protein
LSLAVAVAVVLRAAAAAAAASCLAHLLAFLDRRTLSQSARAALQVQVVVMVRVKKAVQVITPCFRRSLLQAADMAVVAI